MNKNTYTSLLKTFSLLMTSFLEIIFGILLLVCFVVDSPKNLKIEFSIIIVSLISFQYIILFLIDRFFSHYGKNKIIITKNHIKTRKYDIFINESTKILYTPISFSNLLDHCPPELVVIKDGKEINLGWFTKREIKKIMEFIPNVRFV